MAKKGVHQLEQEILALEIAHDEVPQADTARRQEITERVEALRAQLAALQEAAPGVGADIDAVAGTGRDLVGEAKDHIATVGDILGAGSPKRETQARRRELEGAIKRERKNIANAERPWTRDSADQIEESRRNIHEIERALADLEPETAAVDLVMESAIGVAADEARAATAAERDRRAVADAAAAVAKGSTIANRGDLEAAVRATSDEPDPMAIDNARASDDLIKQRGCLPPVLAGITIAVIIAAILVAVAGGGDGDPDGNGAATRSSTTVAPAGPAAPPAEADLPQGAVLFQGTSGGDIGCIGCDGQNRFLSLEREGVVVGVVDSASVESIWKLDGQVLEFGARLGAANKGRYGVNLWVDGAYGPGVALEIGQRAAVYEWHPERDGPLRAGQRVSIIVGEAGTVDDEGVPTAQGAYPLEWWFEFQPG